MRILATIFFTLIIFVSCNKSCPEENSEFPPEVQIIFTNKCATAGCHNATSFANAANLNMTDWNTLLKGAVNGSVIVPFSPNQSSLLQFVNTHADLGSIGQPTMPLNEAALSRAEVLAIKHWIELGCPNIKGEIPFASNSASRAKAYITNQGCDLVCVIDATTRQVMRYVSVGHDEVQIEVPHNVKVSSDGKYWYVCFANGAYLQKYDAVSDTLIKEVNITQGAWNVIKLSPDNSKALISDLTNNGRIVEVNLNTMTINKVYSGSGLFSSPHGLAYTQSTDTFYATAQYGNMIYRVIPSLAQVDNLSIEKGVAPVTNLGSLEPHEVAFDPSFSKLFITCQKSNELRVFDVKGDTLLKVIPVGNYPLEMAFSIKRNLLFISCQEDTNPIYSFFRGGVYVIDMSTYQIVRKIHEKFFQPHGLMVDDKQDLLYIASRNVDPNGPAPHHVSNCAGRNGFYHVINLNTWEAITRNAEISVDPYSVDVRP